jgi:hypothetical protein
MGRGFPPLLVRHFGLVFVFKEGAGFWVLHVILRSRRAEFGSHLVEGNGDNLLHGKNPDPAAEIVEASPDAFMDLLSGPCMPVLKLFEDVDPAHLVRRVFEPAVPGSVIGKPILPRAGSEDLVPRLGPGEFVL